MPYLVASIISVVTAMVILFTRYEADDSTIKAELENMRVMFSMVDGFVNTYIESGESLSSINFEVLADNGILPNVGTSGNQTRITPADAGGISTTMRLPNSGIVWHLIPNISDGSSYKVLVDIRANAGLMSKSIFSESFMGREFCEKNLFGTFETKSDSFDETASDFEDSGSGTNKDGFFTCVVYK